MITWDNFYLFAIVAVALWILGAGFALFSNVKSRMAVILSVLGTITLSVFIAGFWISLQRPPLRTMGETRLWYSFFMGVSGLLTYLRWKYRWILAFSTIVGTVFVLLNILKPEIHDQSLMPALQSFWFVPHVTVYMFSYSVLGCAFILSCMGLYRHRENYLEAADNLVYTGVAFFTIGMLTGAGYLLYIHLRLFRRSSPRTLYWVLIVSFLSLQMCWYGVNYLPSAQQSIHLYNRS